MELYAIEKETVLNERYEVISLIGNGGFSIIYKAYDRELQSNVAIKEYFPNNIAERIPHSCEVLTRNSDAEERFKRGMKSFKEEAHRMAELGGLHNTINVLGAFDENGTSYIVMELLEGISLLEYFKMLPGNRFEDIDDAKQIILSVAEALEYSHSKKILHRDVSPDNIFLCNDGKVKLIDFGAAREFKTDEELSVVVKSGCTPPEQYRKNGKQGPWTDIYALGATFYRMLTGEYPESAPDRMTTENECIPPSSLNPKVPEYIDAFVLRCLAYDHNLRLSKASDAIYVLRKKPVIKLPGEVKAEHDKIKRLSYTLLSACFVMFLIICIVIIKKSETIYNVKIKECDITVMIPEEFSSYNGIRALKEDFQSVCPQITINFINSDEDSENAENADIFIYDETVPCASLEKIQKVEENTNEEFITVAYDAKIVYWNSEKAFYCGIDVNEINSVDDIKPEYYAESFDMFFDDTNNCCAYLGSVALYKDVQKKIPGMYKVYSYSEELEPICLSVASDISENEKNAAMRFLLYLISERAQKILFINNEGLIPSEKNQYDHFFEIYSELAFMQ